MTIAEAPRSGWGAVATRLGRGVFATAPPRFLILGAQRSGTTFLRERLDAHPDVRMARRWRRDGRWRRTGEIHYFGRDYAFGPEWYASLFRHPRWRPAPCFGEKSPSYLCDPVVPERVARDLPDVRMLVLLRNPAERAWSHHRLRVRTGRTTADFGRVLERELRRWHDGLGERFMADALDREVRSAWRNPIARGVYAPQLRRWWKHVPRDRFWIATTEELFSDTASTWRGLLEFLELPHHPLGELPPRPPWQAMPPDARERLTDFYRPHVEDLARLLDRDLGWGDPPG